MLAHWNARLLSLKILDQLQLDEHLRKVQLSCEIEAATIKAVTPQTTQQPTATVTTPSHEAGSLVNTFPNWGTCTMTRLVTMTSSMSRPVSATETLASLKEAGKHTNPSTMGNTPLKKKKKSSGSEPVPSTVHGLVNQAISNAMWEPKEDSHGAGAVGNNNGGVDDDLIVVGSSVIQGDIINKDREGFRAPHADSDDEEDDGETSIGIDKEKMAQLSVGLRTEDTDDTDADTLDNTEKFLLAKRLRTQELWEKDNDLCKAERTKMHKHAHQACVGADGKVDLLAVRTALEKGGKFNLMPLAFVRSKSKLWQCHMRDTSAMSLDCKHLFPC